MEGFSKQALRDLLGRIVEMRCLKMVSLRGNGMGEECAEEVETLLNIKRITRVDLSRNELGRTCLQIISKNFSHLEWVEYRSDHLVSVATLSSSTTPP